MRNPGILFIFVLILAISSIRCGKNGPADNDIPLLEFDSLYVALYMDDAVWASCSYYTEKLLKETELPYNLINSNDIKQGKLIQYSVLLMPGGPPNLYASRLGDTGRSIIRDWVRSGGGFIGISGAAVFAVQASDWQGLNNEPLPNFENLGISRSSASGPIEAFSPTFQDMHSAIKIVNKQHAVTIELPDTVYSMYDHGPMFDIKNDSKATVLGRSIKGDVPVIITTQFDNGRIFLTGLHHEILSDQNSVDLMRNAIMWCSRVDQ